MLHSASRGGNNREKLGFPVIMKPSAKALLAFPSQEQGVVADLSAAFSRLHISQSTVVRHGAATESAVAAAHATKEIIGGRSRHGLLVPADPPLRGLLQNVLAVHPAKQCFITS